MKSVDDDSYDCEMAKRTGISNRRHDHTSSSSKSWIS